MPTRATRYRPRPDREDRVGAILSDMGVVLQAPFSDRFRKRMVDQLLWDLTEVDGKFGCRYRSQGVLENDDRESIYHEHVFTRQKMIVEILGNPGRSREIAQRAVPLSSDRVRASTAKANRPRSRRLGPISSRRS